MKCGFSEVLGLRVGGGVRHTDMAAKGMCCRGKRAHEPSNGKTPRGAFGRLSPSLSSHYSHFASAFFSSSSSFTLLRLGSWMMNPTEKGVFHRPPWIFRFVCLLVIIAVIKCWGRVLFSFSVLTAFFSSLSILFFFFLFFPLVWFEWILSWAGPWIWNKVDYI